MNTGLKPRLNGRFVQHRTPEEIRQRRNSWTRKRYSQNGIPESRKKWEHTDKGKLSVRMTKRRQRFRTRYGITVEDYNRLYEKQGGKCAACGRNGTSQTNPGDVLKDRRGNTDALVIDHCHHVERVRGLLCQWCNRAAGLVGDNPLTLRKLAAYLEGGAL